MNFRNCAAAVVVLAATASLTSAQANDTITGRWAADASACALFGAAGSSSLVVTENAMRWHDDACRIARMYKTGDTVHMQALCRGHGGKRSIPVALRAHGGRLAVTWNRAPRGDLRRCR